MTESKQYDDCPKDLIPTRASLLGRLQNWEDKESWRTFFDTYWRLIYGFALKRGLRHEEAQDAVQETVVAVAKNIANFKYNAEVCAFKTWLLGVTRSKIANQFARRARQPMTAADLTIESSDTELLGIPDEQSGEWQKIWDKEWEQNVMETAIQRIRARVSIEQYQMFDLFVLKQWPARDVSRTLGVTVAHVYVAKHRLTRLIQKEVQLLQTKGI